MRQGPSMVLAAVACPQSVPLGHCLAQMQNHGSAQATLMGPLG